MAKKVARVLRIDTLTGPTGGQTGRATAQLQKVKEQDDRMDTTETKRDTYTSTMVGRYC